VSKKIVKNIFENTDDDKIADTAPLLKLNSIFPCLPNARSQHASSIPPDTAG